MGRMYRIILLFATMSAPYISAMKVGMLSPITQWPCQVFNNSFQGSNYVFTKNGINKHIMKSRTMEKPATEKDCIIYGWLYTLDKVQQKLLQKPFKDWALGDIISIAQWLQRFSEERPGTLRSTRTCTRLRVLTKDEWKEFVPKFLELKKEFGDRLIDDHMFPRMADEYPDGVVFHHTLPDGIKEALRNALHKAQEACAQLTTIEDLYERQRTCTHIAAELHYDIFQIRPLLSANKRLGRILMNVIHMQYGFNPLAITNKNTCTAEDILGKIWLNTMRTPLELTPLPIPNCNT